MNKNDIILILTVSLITILLFVIPTRNSNYAYVYYDGTNYLSAFRVMNRYLNR